jgi:hypothetical protein
MMKIIQKTARFLLIGLLPLSSVNAIDIVYSSINVKDCLSVGEYRKYHRHATRKKVEERLARLAQEDNATHVYIEKYSDRTREGKGIRVSAIGKRCDQALAGK